MTSKQVFLPLIAALMMAFLLPRAAEGEAVSSGDQSDIIALYLWMFEACKPLEPERTAHARANFLEAMFRSEGVDKKRIAAILASHSSKILREEGAKELENITTATLREKCEGMWQYADMQLPPPTQYLTRAEFWRNANLNDVKKVVSRYKTLPEMPVWTPLIVASGASDSPAVIQTLIDAWGGVNTHAQMPRSEEDGTTPLISAAQSNDNVHVLKVLLRNGAKINARTADGRTALMWAAGRSENPEIIQALISAGCNITTKDNQGRTALYYLKKNRSKSVEAQQARLRKELMP